jgi:hypothetical protein
MYTNIILSLVKYIAQVPFSIVPVATWAVFALVMLSLYQYYPVAGIDYIVLPVALGFVFMTAYRRDRWAGVAGVAAGIALLAAFNMLNIVVSATDIFWQIVFQPLASVLIYIISASAAYLFILFILMLIPIVNIIIGLIAGVLAGFLLSGSSMLASYINSSLVRFIHKMIYNLPPGAMALAALPAAATAGALQTTLMIVLAGLAFALTVVTLLAAAIGSLVFGFDVAAGLSFAVGMIITTFWHKLDYDIMSPAVIVATIIATVAGFATPATRMAISVARLLSSRRGHKADMWIAAALIAHSIILYLTSPSIIAPIL